MYRAADGSGKSRNVHGRVRRSELRGIEKIENFTAEFHVERFL